MINKQSIFQYLVFTVFVFLLAGCAATGKPFEKLAITPNNKAGVYIYRENNLLMYGEIPDVLIDGKKVGRIKNKGYLYTEINPGKHLLQIKYTNGLIPLIKLKALQKTFIAKAGKQIFFEVKATTSDQQGYVTSVNGAPLMMNIPTFILRQRYRDEALFILTDLNRS